MKISNLSYMNFKGHAAGKIKALYMQNPANSTQVNVYNEMLHIAHKEGFDVFMNNGVELIDEKIYIKIKSKYSQKFPYCKQKQNRMI